MRLHRHIAVVLALLSATPACAQQLWSRRTENLNLVYYDKSHEYLTYHLARSFENSLRFHRDLFDYTPSEPVLILMQDFGDYGHGGASTIPWNYISVGIEPFDYVYETMPANERMNWLMHHELVHIVATDKAAGSDLFFRRLFRGKVAPIKENPISMIYSYLTSPRWYSPRWYHEGIATFLETWMAGGLGRALGGYDEMVFRTMVLENSRFYDVVGLESEGTTIDFQVGQNSYLYGTRFVTFLAVEHGPEKVIEWFNRTSDSRRYFKSQFEKVFAVRLDDEWRRWIASERVWQSKNLERIRQHAVTPEQRVTTETLGSISRTFHDPERNLIYAAINRPARVAQIVSIDLATGGITPLAEVDSPALYFVTSLAHDPKARKLYFTSDNSNGWRDLHELDLDSRRRRQLIENCRVGDLVVNRADGSIWGIQHHNGFSSLVRIPTPHDKWTTVLTLDYGRDIFDLDISPDGKTLSASLIEVSGEQQLIALDIEKLLAGDSAITPLHTFARNSPANFVFSPDGRHLYGTSYYTGVSNVFRYDRAARTMDAMTNAETGLFRPLPLSDDRLVAYRYTAGGFTPVVVPIEVREDINAIEYLGQQVVERHPVVKEWNAGSPARVNLDETTTYAGEYRVFSQVRLGSVYPIVEGYRDTVAGGVRMNFADPLGLMSFDVTAAVSAGDVASDERFHLKMGYERAPWRVRLHYNATDFYDLFGPTKSSRKGHSASVAYHQYLVYERPKLVDYTISAAYYGGLDTLPEFQNIAAPFTRYATVRAQLDSKNLRRTIGAVDVERGNAWSVAVSGSLVESEVFPRVHGTYDHGFMLPIDHSSIWLRAAAGKSWGDRTNAFSNFFFGGFGNNWIDHQEVQRYRQSYSFPGLELNEAGGNDFAKGTIEWTLPAVRFRRAGVPSLYANWARLALFTSTLVTDAGTPAVRRELSSLGAQVDLSLVIFSSLDSTLSFGYATAFEGGEASNEVMVSLKLLR
ncbi:MAG TPA: hypothetical protein VNA04_16455 [Thermoanaerobaculia bacterium]|nr:hypothetical protein [Thermoanaerobaculia bacterium]